MRIPPGTPSGKVLRVRGQGMAGNNGAAGGDLLVTVDVQIPEQLNEEQRAAVEALAVAFGDDPRAAIDEQRHNRRRDDVDAES
jgi:molecular chaperone DnaJ